MPTATGKTDTPRTRTRRAVPAAKTPPPIIVEDPFLTPDTLPIPTTTAATPEPAEQPDTTTGDDPDQRPTHHNGIAIRHEQLLYSLHPNATFRYSRLHLEDESTAFACRDCPETFDTRGTVMAHRNRIHGSRYGKKNRSTPPTPGPGQAPDPVLPPRDDTTPTPGDAMDWTLRELLALAPSLTALGDLIEKLETERDQLKLDLLNTRNTSREDQHKINVYDSLRAEVIELRSWKKKTIAKFESLGFRLATTDEEG